MKQKLVCAFLCCVLMLALHLAHIALDQEQQGEGRKMLKEMGFSTPARISSNEKAERTDGEKEHRVEVSSVGIKAHRYDQEEGGLLYSADYSSSTTHHPPVTKHHPKPKPLS